MFNWKNNFEILFYKTLTVIFFTSMSLSLNVLFDFIQSIKYNDIKIEITHYNMQNTFKILVIIIYTLQISHN